MRDLFDVQTEMTTTSAKAIASRNLLKEENIVFHNLGNDFSKKQSNTEDDQDLEAYRRRFEEAMIRIEDQEDVAAYREAKREIDDEFDEKPEDKVEKEDKDNVEMKEEVVREVVVE